MTQPLARLLYLLPTNLVHEGIRIKVMGQLAALEPKYRCTLLHLNFKRSSFFLLKVWQYILFEFKSLFALLIYPTIYIRYNPKTVLINLSLLPLSFFKTIVLEHNIKLHSELEHLKRPIEQAIHSFNLRYLSLSRCKHVAVTNEIKSYLESFGLTRVMYSQNRYLADQPSPDDISGDQHSSLKALNSFKKRFEYVAIFCGNGYAWHGLDEVLHLISAQPNTGLVIVGPYEQQHNEQLLYIPFLNTQALSLAIEACDFAISTFRWDIISINEGCPLKSRQYLCHGCPTLVNYYDCAADYDALKPFIVDYKVQQDNSIPALQALSKNKAGLKETAREYLSWQRYFSDIGL